MVLHEIKTLSRFQDAFVEARELILNEGHNLVERVVSAWRLLPYVDLEEIPQPLRDEWRIANERAGRLAKVGNAAVGSPWFLDAADLGSVLLLIEWLLRQDVCPREAQA